MEHTGHHSDVPRHGPPPSHIVREDVLIGALPEEQIGQLRRAQANVGELPAKMKATLADLEQVQSRLGTPDQKHDDMDSARQLAHRYMNDLFVFSMSHQLETPTTGAVQNG